MTGVLAMIGAGFVLIVVGAILVVVAETIGQLVRDRSSRRATLLLPPPPPHAEWLAELDRQKVEEALRAAGYRREIHV